jgi:hypothetical protein
MGNNKAFDRWVIFMLRSTTYTATSAVHVQPSDSEGLLVGAQMENNDVFDLRDISIRLPERYAFMVPDALDYLEEHYGALVMLSPFSRGADVNPDAPPIFTRGLRTP